MDKTGVDMTENPSEVALLDWSDALNSAATTIFEVPIWLDACKERDQALHAAATGASFDTPIVTGGAIAEAVTQVAIAWFGHRRPIQRHAIIFEMEIALRLALHGLACAPPGSVCLRKGARVRTV